MTHIKTEKHLQSVDLCQAVHFPHIVTYTCSVYTLGFANTYAAILFCLLLKSNF